jgi:hypothetical protein
MRYFEKGFISSGFKKTNDTEELDLIWDENKNKSILAKQKTIEDLTSMYLRNSYEGSIDMRKSGTLDELHKDIIQGKSLVRCFSDPLRTGSWYGVYESVDGNYGVNLGETK